MSPLTEPLPGFQWMYDGSHYLIRENAETEGLIPHHNPWRNASEEEVNRINRWMESQGDRDEPRMEFRILD